MERKGLCFRCRITHYKYLWSLLSPVFRIHFLQSPGKYIIQVEPMPISKAEGIMCVDIMAPSTSVLGLPSYSLIQHLLLSAVMIKASVYPKWDVLHFWSLDKASFVFSTYISWGCLLHRAGDTCAELRMAFILSSSIFFIWELLNIFFQLVHLMSYIPPWIKGSHDGWVCFYSFPILSAMESEKLFFKGAKCA